MLTRQDMTGVQTGAPTKLVLGFHHAGYLDWKPAVVASNREEPSRTNMAGLVGSGAWLGCPFPLLARDDMVTAASSLSKHLPQTSSCTRRGS